jgi:hypothetical protein
MWLSGFLRYTISLQNYAGGGQKSYKKHDNKNVFITLDKAKHQHRKYRVFNLKVDR